MKTIPCAWNILSILNSLFSPRVFGKPCHNLLPLPESCSSSWDFRHPLLGVIHVQAYPLVPAFLRPQDFNFQRQLFHTHHLKGP